MLNPNTGTLPIFRTRRDADITLACYRRHPVLIHDGDPDGNPWGLRFATLFHMANDSGLFRTADDLRPEGAAFDGWAWTEVTDAGCRCTRPRCSATGTTASPPTRAPLRPNSTREHFQG